jgi:hypothetical protein
MAAATVCWRAESQYLGSSSWTRDAGWVETRSITCVSYSIKTTAVAPVEMTIRLAFPFMAPSSWCGGERVKGHKT